MKFSEMKNDLYLFVGNHFPNLYINIIGYLIYKHGKNNINKISLVSIYDYPFEKKKEALLLQKTRDNIKKQLDFLKDNKYCNDKWESLDQAETSAEQISISNQYIEIYSTIRETIANDKLSFLAIYEENVEATISQIINQKSDNHNIIFDVTGLVKRYFAEVLMILHEKQQPIYSFEVLRNFKEIKGPILIHNLKKTDIRYNTINQVGYTVSKNSIH